MESLDKLNRRKFPRITYPCLIVIRNGFDENNKSNTLLTHTENVGIGGVCITLKEDVKVFSSVDIELDLLDLENHICCCGKVVWSVQRKNDSNKIQLFDVGIEFADLANEDESRLGKIVERLEKNGK